MTTRMNNTNLTFFTIVARNYLAYAYTLGDSVKKWHPNATFLIFLTDDIEKTFTEEIKDKGFCVIYPDQVGISNYRSFVFKYNVTEASTAVKPFVLDYLLSLGYNKVIYLDPDILCLQALDKVITLLDDYSIVITPHSNSPVQDDSFPTDAMHIYTGVYNLGFIAVANTSVTEKFVLWWKRQLFNLCLDSPEVGVFVDQKWIDLVPAFFPQVYILRDLSYNVAYWNFHERTVVRIVDSWIIKETGDLIVFFHFSGIPFDDLDKVTKYGPKSPFNTRTGQIRLTLKDKPDLRSLYQFYVDKLYAAEMKKYGSIEYAYARYRNGELISQLERSVFFASPRWHSEDIDPFSTVVGSFWHECRRKGIRAAESKATSASAEEIVGSYKSYFRIIQLFLRLILFLLGPNLYIKFSKYLREQLLLQNHAFLIE